MVLRTSSTLGRASIGVERVEFQSRATHTKYIVPVGVGRGRRFCQWATGDHSEDEHTIQEQHSDESVHLERMAKPAFFVEVRPGHANEDEIRGDQTRPRDDRHWASGQIERQGIPRCMGKRTSTRSKNKCCTRVGKWEDIRSRKVRRNVVAPDASSDGVDDARKPFRKVGLSYYVRRRSREADIRTHKIDGYGDDGQAEDEGRQWITARQRECPECRENCIAKWLL